MTRVTSISHFKDWFDDLLLSLLDGVRGCRSGGGGSIPVVTAVKELMASCSFFAALPFSKQTVVGELSMSLLCNGTYWSVTHFATMFSFRLTHMLLMKGVYLSVLGQVMVAWEEDVSITMLVFSMEALNLHNTLVAVQVIDLHGEEEFYM